MNAPHPRLFWAEDLATALMLIAIGLAVYVGVPS